MYNKKKYFFATLCTLLLTLLLGTYGTCYATEFSDNDLKNVFYNSLTNFGQHDSQVVKNALDSFDFSPWNLTSEYSYTTIYCKIQENGLANNSSYNMYIYYNNDATKKSQVGYNYCKAYYYIQYRNGVVTKDFGGVLNSSMYIQQNGHAYNYMVRYNDLDLYNGAGNTVTVSAGWHPSNIDEGVFVDRYWSFTPSNNNRVYVPSFTTYPDVAMTPISVNESNLGTLIGGLHCDQIRIVRVYYSNGEWVMSKGQTWYQFPKNGTLMNFTGGYIDNDWTCPININFGNYANNIIAIQFNSNDDTYDSIRHWFFITNNKTVVTNDNVDISGTITGDYANDYNQQNNTNDIIGATEDSTQEITDTITDDSNVQDTLDNFTNTSGDILNSFGYSPLENPFLIIIKNVLTSIKDVLLGSGNETLEISWGGRTTYLHSEEFVFPNGLLFTLIHLICNGFFIWGLYKYGFKLYQWINMGQMDRLVKHTLDDWDKTFWF